jgi:ubiquinone/menaquinone biosynthesis C-methylase UbiE
MSNAKKKYYEEAYTVKDVRKSPLPTITALSHVLSRFDVPGHKVIFDLLTPQEKLLDIGCGEGSFLLSAKDKFTDLYGIDISETAIKHALELVSARKDKSYFHFSAHDIDEDLPFNDCFFDAVTCIAVLEHTVNPPWFLKEIKRVLKNRGELAILIPNDAWLPYRLQYLIGKIPQSGGVDELGVDWGHLHKFNKEIISKLLLSIGYRITDVTCSGIFARPRKKWLSVLSGDIIIKAVKQ